MKVLALVLVLVLSRVLLLALVMVQKALQFLGVHILTFSISIAAIITTATALCPRPEAGRVVVALSSCKSSTRPSSFSFPSR